MKIEQSGLKILLCFIFLLKSTNPSSLFESEYAAPGKIVEFCLNMGANCLYQYHWWCTMTFDECLTLTEVPTSGSGTWDPTLQWPIDPVIEDPEWPIGTEGEQPIGTGGQPTGTGEKPVGYPVSPEDPQQTEDEQTDKTDTPKVDKPTKKKPTYPPTRLPVPSNICETEPYINHPSCKMLKVFNDTQLDQFSDKYLCFYKGSRRSQERKWGFSSQSSHNPCASPLGYQYVAHWEATTSYGTPIFIYHDIRDNPQETVFQAIWTRDCNTFKGKFDNKYSCTKTAQPMLIAVHIDDHNLQIEQSIFNSNDIYMTTGYVATDCILHL